ncbi:MAG: PIN domain nuclease [Dehalococcoidia bacterium]|nr:PIN domain nuclease [Dehalococcoidia bacterium]MDP7083070.1 PIN domain nuclease [Dehalococcoidia bacterium]MDP7510827.1 PIN domain nuclease [Dehalococcoidia bacterium]HJN88058.1 PIN domain nuclease [Dehalococcoidia bacterium]
MVALLTLRALGAGGFGVLGWRLGAFISELSYDEERFLPWGLALTLTGLPIGAFLAPYLTIKPWRKVADYLDSIPGSSLIAGTVGLLVGLVVASLVSIPLYSLDGWKGWGVPVIVSLILGLCGLWLGVARRRDLQAIFPALESTNTTGRLSRNGSILVDTSAIIDGRIADLSITGFLEGILVVPRFILDELRHIADSSDPLRRNRGRRGLEVLGRLRKDNTIPMEVLDVGVSGGDEVDSRLVQLARTMKSPILTTDYNLNRVAELQGVQVLNVNELANALKSIVLPGEEMRVNIVQEGKEVGQGVAYLDDGTMVVVEGGRRYLNAYHDVMVTRVLQTAAGRIIFAQPKGG